jgi:threonyl-tRNA synthetase
MAQAILEMFPEAKYTIGPPIENGFYYDFDLPRTLTPEDLEKIEKRMRQIIAGNMIFKRQVVSADEARQIFKNQPYKLELIEGLEKGGLDEYGNPLDVKPEISIYQQDSFVDLCRGPHVENTKQINPSAIKLMNVSGAYWRGDEHNPMLQRIYGTAWHTKQELDAYLQQLEEAKKRDHRKLGKDLEIFIFDEEVGPGLPLWLPHGGVDDRGTGETGQGDGVQSRLRARAHSTPDQRGSFRRSGHLPTTPRACTRPWNWKGEIILSSP